MIIICVLTALDPVTNLLFLTHYTLTHTRASYLQVSQLNRSPRISSKLLIIPYNVSDKSCTVSWGKCLGTFIWNICSYNQQFQRYSSGSIYKSLSPYMHTQVVTRCSGSQPTRPLMEIFLLHYSSRIEKQCLERSLKWNFFSCRTISSSQFCVE